MTKSKHLNPKKPLLPSPKTIESIEISEKAVERLTQYRHILQSIQMDGQSTIFSHEIAQLAGATSAQVRRDLMEVGYAGHPRHGYEVSGLLTKLDRFFLSNSGIQLALVGVGNLGRAILSYFSSKGTQFTVVGAFDNDPAKQNRTICGSHCQSIDQIGEVLAGKKIDVGIIAVPAGEAQYVTDQLIRAGVQGILNLAPVHLKVPPSVYVEDFDLTRSIEKVAFFTKKFLQPQQKRKQP